MLRCGRRRRTTDSVQMASRLDKMFDEYCNLLPRKARNTGGRTTRLPAAFHFHVESPPSRMGNRKNVRGWHANLTVANGAHRIAPGVGG